MLIRRNLVANYAGQGWAAAMNLAFIPIYIRLLGLESYGLIGLFAVLQAWLGLLDFGMTPTLGREMARFTAGAHSAQTIRDLLRSMETICLLIAVAICMVVYAGSSWLASDWLRAERLPLQTVADAIAVMSLVLALRFWEGIYRSVLVGLQKQVLYNVLNAATTTLRSVGAVAVLWSWTPTIGAFFAWQAVASAVSLVALAAAAHRSLPKSPRPASFSLTALRDVGRFAGGMTGVALLAVLLTQVDKVLVSRLVPLDVFALYALATAICGGLYVLVTPITTAFYPRLVELHAQQDMPALVQTYHYGAQLVTLTLAPAALLIAAFGKGTIYAWSGNTILADGAAPILSVMSLGTFASGLMYMPYQLQVAHGWTGLVARANIVAVVIVVPLLLVVVPRFGAVGAAFVWLGLNLAYLAVLVPLMHRYVLPGQARAWYSRDVAMPAAASGAVIALASLAAPVGLQQNRAAWAGFIAACYLAALTAAAFAAPAIRARVRPGLANGAPGPGVVPRASDERGSTA